MNEEEIYKIRSHKSVLAYLVGALADGYIYHNPKHYIYRVSYYQKLRKYFSKCIEPRIVQIFNNRGHFYHDHRKDVYYYEITSKSVYQKMCKAAGPFKGHQKRNVPLWILDGDIKVQRAFVQGFFDADGYYVIDEINSDYRVRFGQSEYDILAGIRNILIHSKFNCSNVLGPYRSKPNVKPYYELHIHGLKQVLRFQKVIRPCHPQKQLILKNA